MATRKERGPSNRFYVQAPPSLPQSKPKPRPVPPPQRERVESHAENLAESDKSSTTKNVPRVPQRRLVATKTPQPPRNRESNSYSPRSLSTPSVKDAALPTSAAKPSSKKPNVRLSEKREASQSPFREQKVHVTSPDSMFFPPKPVSSAWKKKMNDAGTASEPFLKTASPKLQEDATRFGLNVGVLIQLRSKAWHMRGKAYCMLRR